MASVCSNPNPVNATADELRDSYTAVQDDIRRLELAVREDAVQTEISTLQQNFTLTKRRYRAVTLTSSG